MAVRLCPSTHHNRREEPQLLEPPGEQWPHDHNGDRTGADQPGDAPAEVEDTERNNERHGPKDSPPAEHEGNGLQHDEQQQPEDATLRVEHTGQAGCRRGLPRCEHSLDQCPISERMHNGEGHEHGDRRTLASARQLRVGEYRNDREEQEQQPDVGHPPAGLPERRLEWSSGVHVCGHCRPRLRPTIVMVKSANAAAQKPTFNSTCHSGSGISSFVSGSIVWPPVSERRASETYP